MQNENVAYGLKSKKAPKSEITSWVEKALDLVQISQLKDRNPSELSGDQQQRVALARAFVIEPGILLMDETLSNLDAKLRVQMRTVIRKIQKRVGITTIYVIHDQKETLAISDRIAIMKAGDIMQVGTPEEIYKKPATISVAIYTEVVRNSFGTVAALASILTLATVLPLALFSWISKGKVSVI